MAFLYEKIDILRENGYISNMPSYIPSNLNPREFITSDSYLGNIKMEIRSQYDEPPIAILSSAVAIVIEKIAATISSIEEEYEGTKDFRAVNIRDIFHDKAVNYTNIVDGGIGTSQNDATVPDSIELQIVNASA